jgi:multidrug resistance efflux pump
MAIGASDVTMAQPARRRRRLRITVLRLLVLVALSALALFLYRKYLLPPNEQPTIVVAYRKVAPTVDGAIGEHVRPGRDDHLECRQHACRF